jgi:hypothetical protein
VNWRCCSAVLPGGKRGGALVLSEEVSRYSKHALLCRSGDKRKYRYQACWRKCDCRTEYAVDPGQWFTVLGVGVARCKDGVLLYGDCGQQGSCHAVRYCFLVISCNWGNLVGAVSSLRMPRLIHRLVPRQPITSQRK